MRVKSQGQRGQSPGLTAMNPEARESEGQTLSPRLWYRAQCSLGIDVGVLDAVDLGEYLVSQRAVLAGSSLPPPHLPQEYLPSVAEGARVRLVGAHPAGCTSGAGWGGTDSSGRWGFGPAASVSTGGPSVVTECGWPAAPRPRPLSCPPPPPPRPQFTSVLFPPGCAAQSCSGSSTWTSPSPSPSSTSRP